MRGNPSSSGEVTNEIVKKVGSTVDVCIEDTDISISHRIKCDSAIPPIIVKFIRRRVRDDLYKPRCKLKNLTIEDIGLGRQGDNKIFIQESLTPSRRGLFHKSNEFKKKFKFRYIWSFYGNIFLRKDDASPAVKICSLKDLAKLEAKLKPSLSTGMEECSTVPLTSSTDSNGTGTG